MKCNLCKKELIYDGKEKLIRLDDFEGKICMLVCGKGDCVDTSNDRLLKQFPKLIPKWK